MNKEITICKCLNPKCGYWWLSRSLERPPARCPRCQSRHWGNPSYWSIKDKPDPRTEKELADQNAMKEASKHYQPPIISLDETNKARKK